MIRKFVGVLLAALLAGLAWYLFILPFEFKVTFQTKALPGVIEQCIKTGFTHATYSKEANEEVLQQITMDSSEYQLTWLFKELNDSTTSVSVLFHEPGRSLLNKFLVPFRATQIESHAEESIREFYEALKKHISNFKVKVEGPTELDRMFYVYAPVKTTQTGKAGGMMAHYNLISSFVVSNQLETRGVPLLSVDRWDEETDSLYYHFGFPVLFKDTLPEHELLKYQWIGPKKVIKAVYHGNYITSDRAWYALRNYAKKNKLEVVGAPIEFFYSNPNFGGNELKWKAEVFLPIK